MEQLTGHLSGEWPCSWSTTGTFEVGVHSRKWRRHDLSPSANGSCQSTNNNSFANSKAWA